MDTNASSQSIKHRTITVSDDEYHLFYHVRKLYRRIVNNVQNETGDSEELLIVQIKPTGIKCREVGK